jgi:membrane protein YqaA with SNARE-associated domain
VITDAIWGVLVLGGASGWFLGRSFGRWRAENRRARFDQDRIWSARKNYRKGSGSPPPPTL